MRDSRNPACDKRRYEQRDRHDRKRCRVHPAYAVQPAREHTRRGKGGRKPDRDAASGESGSLPDKQAHHVAAARPERHTNADLSRALERHVRHDAVHAGRREDEGHGAEESKEA